MATLLETSIRISAPASVVWAELTRFDSYADWNPFIQSLEGTVAKGNRIKVQLTPPGQKGMTFKPVITRLTQNQELEWLGNLIIPGLFDGRHRFELQSNPDGSTTLIQSERFTGILVPFLKKMIQGATRDGFIAMNEALKKRIGEVG